MRARLAKPLGIASLCEHLTLLSDAITCMAVTTCSVGSNWTVELCQGQSFQCPQPKVPSSHWSVVVPCSYSKPCRVCGRTMSQCAAIAPYSFQVAASTGVWPQLSMQVACHDTPCFTLAQLSTDHGWSAKPVVERQPGAAVMCNTDAGPC